VSNSVDLRSSASVHVAGDNYNPINIVLDLAANLVNWGVATATSGDAQATGAGGGTATSGAASATGLRAVNLVSMWADAAVDIDGNNYAPIFIKIQFKTNIANIGYAGASSGNVAAGQPGSGGSSGGASSSSTTSGASGGSGGSVSSGGTSSHAQGGNAVAISNSVNADVVSSQMANANGGNSITTTAVGEMLRNLPPGTWDPFVQQNLPDTGVPVPVAGVNSGSGNSTAIGLQTNIGATNGQIAGCADPGVSCNATNSSTMSISMRDLAYNPATKSDGSARGSGQNGKDNDGSFGPGGTSSESGFTGVNATPTPRPLASTGGSGFNDDSDGSGGGGVRRRTTFFTTNAVVTEFGPTGHMVMVDLFDQWPGRRLPPMPNPVKTGVSSSNVDASLAYFPDVDELPLPMPSGQGDVSAPSGARGGVGQGLRRPVGGVSHDQGTGEDDDLYPPLELVMVDPWGNWPPIEALPLPVQVFSAPSVATLETAVVPDAAATPLPPDNGAMPMQFDLAVFLSMLIAALRVATRHGRELMAVLRSWFDQRRRAQILLRLASGMLRLW
jgi:hypothetical protein